MYILVPQHNISGEYRDSVGIGNLGQHKNINDP